MSENSEGVKEQSLMEQIVFNIGKTKDHLDATNFALRGTPVFPSTLKEEKPTTIFDKLETLSKLSEAVASLASEICLSTEELNN